MRRIAPTLVIAVALLGSASLADAIVGGGPAPAGKYPYVADVEIAGAFGCSGSLVAPNWVITAGHCASVVGPTGVPSPFAQPPQNFRVTVGTVNSNGSGGEEHAVKSVHVDPNYAASNGTGSDVALLELSDPAQVMPVKIAAEGEKAIWEPGDVLTIAGFGVTQEGGEPPATLQEAQVPRVSDADCSQAYSDTTPVVGNAFDPATAICAGLPQGGKDTCQGDSGGPILAPLDAGGFRLVGATSYGEGCAREGKPGVYARLAEGSVKRFVSGFVPEAYATSPTPTPSTTPSPSPTASPTPSATATATPAPAASGTCAGMRGLTIVVRGKRLRRAAVLVDGRRIVLRRGRRARRFTVRLAKHLPRTGTATVTVKTRDARGRRRTVTRRYKNCKRRAARSRHGVGSTS